MHSLLCSKSIPDGRVKQLSIGIVFSYIRFLSISLRVNVFL